MNGTFLRVAIAAAPLRIWAGVAYFLRMRTPGRSSLRNSIPAFSNALVTSESVVVREPISPLKLSIRRIVPMATRERFASSICSMPINARAARNCLPVINKAPYHANAVKPKHIYVIHNYLIMITNLCDPAAMPDGL
jgi:hypothetical protein